MEYAREKKGDACQDVLGREEWGGLLGGAGERREVRWDVPGKQE